MKFSTEKLVSAFPEHDSGTALEVKFTAVLEDGRDVVGQDTVTLLTKAGKPDKK